MAGLIGIIVGAATLLLQFAAIRAADPDAAASAEAVVRACASSGALAAWIAVDRTDRRAGTPSSRTAVAVPVTVLLVVLMAVKAIAYAARDAGPLMYAGGVAAVLAGGAIGVLPVLGREYVAPVLALLLVTAGEQAASLAAGQKTWLALPIGFGCVLAATRHARTAGPLPPMLAVAAPVAVAALAAAAGCGLAGHAGPPHRLGWLLAGCALAELLVSIGPRMGLRAHNGG